MLSGFNLHNLPSPLQLAILDFSDVSEQIVVMQVNCYFFQLVQSNKSWERKMEDFFPDDYVRIKKNREGLLLDWYQEYKRAFIRHYAFLEQSSPTLQRVFQLVKRGDLEALKKLQFPLAYFTMQDRDGFTLGYWAHRNKHQAILDFYYARASVNPLYWAVVLFQDEATLAALLAQNSNRIYARENGDGNNPLEVAAKVHNEMALRLFCRNLVLQLDDGRQAWREALHAGHLRVARQFTQFNQSTYHQLYVNRENTRRILRETIDRLPYNALRTLAEEVLDAGVSECRGTRSVRLCLRELGRCHGELLDTTQLLVNTNRLLLEPTPQAFQENREYLKQQEWKRRKQGYIWMGAGMILFISGMILPFLLPLWLWWGCLMVCLSVPFFLRGACILDSDIQRPTRMKLFDFSNKLERLPEEAPDGATFLLRDLSIFNNKKALKERSGLIQFDEKRNSANLYNI